MMATTASNFALIFLAVHAIAGIDGARMRGVHSHPHSHNGQRVHSNVFGAKHGNGKTGSSSPRRRAQDTESTYAKGKGKGKGKGHWRETSAPTANPTSLPTIRTDAPSLTPTMAPTSPPSAATPTAAPTTAAPTATPTASTGTPTTATPTRTPTHAPSKTTTTSAPTGTPTTATPTRPPTSAPTTMPSFDFGSRLEAPTSMPTAASVSTSNTAEPSNPSPDTQTEAPTMSPGTDPTETDAPTVSPTDVNGGGTDNSPTANPTATSGGDNDNSTTAAPTPTNPFSSALTCPGLPVDREEVLTWEYSLEIDTSTTSLTTEEVQSLFEISLLSEMVGLLSCELPSSRRRSLVSEVGVNGISYDPSDQSSTTKTCAPSVDASNTCVVINGRMNMYLDPDADLAAAEFEGRTIIKDTMDKASTGVSSTGVVDATYLGPDLGTADAVTRGGDGGEDVAANNGVSLGAVIFLALSAIVVVVAFVVGYGYRGRRGNREDLTVAAASNLSALNESSFSNLDRSMQRSHEIDQVDDPDADSERYLTLQASGSSDVMTMSAIWEEDEDESTVQSRNGLVMSDSGYTTEEDSVSNHTRVDYENMKMLVDQPVLGALGMVEDDDEMDDADMIFSNAPSSLP